MSGRVDRKCQSASDLGAATAGKARRPASGAALEPLRETRPPRHYGETEQIDMTLQGKTALATGSTARIGRAVAERLASDSAEVMITGRDEQLGNAVIAGIEAAGGQARFVAT